MSLKLQDLSLVYEGSVKQIWTPSPKSEQLWFEYTDDYSVFDWGKMPDTIAHKGRSLAIMGAFFFEQLNDKNMWQALSKSKQLQHFDQHWLSQRFKQPLFLNNLSKHGARNHYLGLTTLNGTPLTYEAAVISSDPIYLKVQKAEVIRPEPHVVMNQTVHYYPAVNTLVQASALRLVPLEVVFRFGMPAGSSLKARLDKDPAYAQVLGLKTIPTPQQWFDRPVVEFFTKLEPKDRLLSIQEALLISGLTPEQFTELVELSYDLALALYVLFADRGIELWDGKFEFAISENGLLLVDSIGPDELRLIYKGCHLSKEMIRQVYRGSSWESSIKEAQEIANRTSRHDWKEICQKELKSEPQQLPSDFKKIIDQLYGSLTNHIVGKQLFSDQPTLDDFVKSIAARK